MSRRATRIGGALLVALEGFGAKGAHAYEAAVSATVDAQIYQVTSPYGAPVVGRRRFTETLGLRVVDIQGPHDPRGPDLSAVMRLRLDADLGQDDAERDPSRGDRFVPGLAQAPLDLMMAYVEGRNYFGGPVGFRLGRQYVVDALGWWSFDGGLVRVTTPAYVAFEAFGGFEQRGGLSMLSTSRFEGDGVFRGDRRGMDGNLFPAYLSESKLAPAYGFAVASSGLRFLDTRLTYRKVVNRDTVLISPFPDANGNFSRTSGDRVSSERVGLAGTATANDLGTLQGNVVYDAYTQKLTDYGLSADFRGIDSIDLGVDGGYFLPTFDGDSIFNWFSHFGTTTLTARARWDASRRISFGGSGGVRRFSTEGANTLSDVLASVDGRYRSPDLALSLRAMDEHGERGLRRGADVSTRRSFERGLYDASAIVSLYDWSDALRPDRSTTSFTYVLGGGYRPFLLTRIGVEWEHSMNDLVGQRFRALCTLDLTVL
jgi:hypothetical protein